MNIEQSSYRPHDPGHNYYDKGIYLVTLVTRGRDPLFGRFIDNIKEPAVELSALGTIVAEQWAKTPELQKKHGNKVKLLNQVCMPDHWHGVIEVEERMSWSLGDVIQAVKAGCTSRWRKLTGFVESPISAERIRHMSHEERARYYAQQPREAQPLFDDDYDDTICFPIEVDMEKHLRHRSSMMHYVDDNIRRAIIRRARPNFMRRCQHVIIDGRDYAAFGNLFLLRWARKVQVMCHRLARRGMLTDEEWKKATASMDTIRAFEAHARAHKLGHFDRDWYRSAHPDTITAIDYTRTAAYRQGHDSWIHMIMAGQTVIVTPGISKGEAQMKDECVERGFPLILLQKEPIGRFWKPEAKRFEACTRGSLLILAPWMPHPLVHQGEKEGKGNNYAIFHNLNKLAEEICLFDGEAKMMKY